jgi:osmoprotectant transport system substrate-binding protein
MTIKITAKAAVAAVAVIGLSAVVACSSSSSTTPTGAASGTAASNGSNPLAGGNASGSVVVGSANFAEDETLAEIYVLALRKAGVNATAKLNIASREIYYPQVEKGAITIVPEYNGGLLTGVVDPKSTAKTTAAVDAELKAKLPSSLTVLDPAPGADSDSITVTKATAAKDNLKSIADLKPYASQLVLGAPPEFRTRADGLSGLKASYDLTFKSFDPLDESGPLTLKALTSGQVQAADLFTTDPSISADNLVALADPKANFAAQNVIPLVYKPALTSTITATLNAVDAKLTTAALLELNTKVKGPAKEGYAQAAQEWLTSVGLG